MGSTSTTSPTGGNATKSLKAFGMQRATTPNKGTSSKASSNLPRRISSGSSATNKRRRSSQVAGSHVFKTCLNCIWESTWSRSLKSTGLFLHPLRELSPTKFTSHLRPLLRLRARRSSCGSRLLFRNGQAAHSAAC